MNLPSTTHLLALLCLFFATLATPLSAQAPKVKKVPFHGKLEAVDPSAQTITLSGKSARIFHLTPSTKITDGAGNPSSLAAATVGEDVGGSYSKGTDGTMTLFSVRFGAKTGAAKSEKSAAAPAPAPIAAATASAATTPAPLTAASVPAAAAPEKKKRFSGKITAVDEAAGTVAVHGMTLATDSGTKFTDASGAAIGLSNLAVGDKVSGSYTPSADGKMTVATLKKSK